MPPEIWIDFQCEHFVKADGQWINELDHIYGIYFPTMIFIIFGAIRSIRIIQTMPQKRLSIAYVCHNWTYLNPVTNLRWGMLYTTWGCLEAYKFGTWQISSSPAFLMGFSLGSLSFPNMGPFLNRISRKKNMVSGLSHFVPCSSCSIGLLGWFSMGGTLSLQERLGGNWMNITASLGSLGAWEQLDQFFAAGCCFHCFQREGTRWCPIVSVS